MKILKNFYDFLKIFLRVFVVGCILIAGCLLLIFIPAMMFFVGCLLLLESAFGLVAASSVNSVDPKVWVFLQSGCLLMMCGLMWGYFLYRIWKGQG